MNKALNSPWLTVSLAIVVMSIGYTVYLMKHGSIAEASYFCPAQEICNSGECAGEGKCDEHKCKSCPNCQKGATS